MQDDEIKEKWKGIQVLTRQEVRHCEYAESPPHSSKLSFFNKMLYTLHRFTHDLQTLKSPVLSTTSEFNG